MENAQIAAVFDQIADLIELRGGSQYRTRSFRQAARTVRDLSQRLEDMVESDADLTELPYIGESSAEAIRELIETGECKRLDELQSELPSELTSLMRVRQLGARKASRLHDELGVGSLEDLEKAAEKHEIREIRGFGEKSEEAILEGVRSLRHGESERFTLHDAEHHVRALGRYLDGLSSIERWQTAGSYRRRKETVGDLDILVHARDRQRAGEALVDYEDVAEVVGRGAEKVTVRLSSGLQVDIRFFEPRNFGAALMYFTGSKGHNIRLRRMAQDHGWKLSEYGLFKGEHLLAGRDEEAVYHRLGLPWIPPELREDRGEISAAQDDALPSLIEQSDLRGDLHCHTKVTDGAATIEEMADAARDRGYDYLAITDHSRSVTMARGLDEEGLLAHAEHIREIDERYDDLWLLAGVEVDILEDGSLDLASDALSQLDWVIASVHYKRELEEKRMTERLLGAIESGLVHCIGHPLGRLLGRREPLSFDVDRVLDACANCGVRLEIDAQPERMDLPDNLCKRAKDCGVGLAINSDAHKPDDLDLISFGIDVARRGWLEATDVLNTRTVARLRKELGT